MIKYEIIKIQGKLFQVKRKFPENRINFKKGSAADLKQYYHCDTLFRAQGNLWLCNEIIDIDYEELR